jgi:cephalosporin-C deacetylase-like acetyl esterase
MVLAAPLAADAQADSAWSVPVEVKSQGVTMRATLFVAAGPGPHGTLVALKGFPGDNGFSFPKFMQSRGFNAIALNFRGQHDSDGTYDVAGTPADAAAMIAFLRSDSARRAFRIDPKRVVVSGSSAGSFAALSTVANDESIRCLTLIVPFNWAIPLLDMRRNPIVRTAMTAQLQSIANRNTAAVRLDSNFASRSVDMADSLDLRTVATRLKGRNVLMVGAQRDATAPLEGHFNPVRDSLKIAQATVRDTIFDDTHYLSSTIPALFEMVAGWMHDCTR